ncbi:filamentous hemagglutinin N-terminal domain-containing protein [Candidatus Synechococcus calcipolaris G9]|uniref:Filamentous hemagglutinin N-terminal domain-containing protein n=1 Tax=Candidatus Synechococcus calcipolaris G9 TaxID=1497997 RepID=A0ABT6F1B9_9SYNE|nr:filamentous hemagglutinin N-terminal domain-containing protein [Candidatus Synechococcus calcipolaris]MDG2991576.1 filamentous hemagglutinin N-terminal domain-containing protein [Candidatus Synechococcus calcipolaris G9]
MLHKLTHLWLSLFAFSGVFLPRPSLAQITPAVGGTGTVVTVNGQQFDIGGGAVSRDGRNLFHLFQQFGLNEGQIANFLSNPGVRNILAGVNGDDVSYINGLIQVMGGNSNLYLLNPAGIVFGPNAQLNVPAAFHASTAQRVHFDGGIFDTNGFNYYANLVGNPTGFEFLSTGIIVNEGNLAVGPGQNLTLMGHQVFNTGTLSAPGGTITIQAIPETGMVRISQEGMILSLEIPADRIPEDGVIEAVDLPRLITGGEDHPRVNSIVHNADGSISLVHDPNRVNVPVEGATAVVSGIIDVSNPEGMGGQINVLGQNVAMLNAQLRADGETGGGTILGGGDYLGGTAGTGRLDSSFNAQHLFVDNNTVMTADALTQGDGGTVINWADNSTVFNGTIMARGGQLGGDGGFVETSGAASLHVGDHGRVDTTAPLGTTGTWLLDPSDLTINATSDNNISGSPNFNTTNSPAVLTATTLQNALLANNVTISTAGGTGGNGDITLNTNVTWTSGNSLTLTMRRFIRDSGLFNHGTGNVTFNLNQVNPETTDPVPTSSIQAVHNALPTNPTVHPGTRTINLGAGTYQGATLTLNRNVTIQGQGAASTILSGQNTRRVVNITGGTTTVNLHDLTITRGNSGDFTGGGILNNGTLTVTNSTISGNTATAGGGIINTGMLTVTNTTISGNTATNTNSGGGGIANNNGTVNVTNSTISGNTANGSGGGIFNNNGTVNVTNSLISGNTAPTGPEINNNGTLNLTGNNLVGQNNTLGISGTISSGIENVNYFAPSVPTSQIIGPLANNGGPTQTHLLVFGSPAINAGVNASVPGTVTTDQRGATRIVNGIVDLGAVEVNYQLQTLQGNNQQALVNSTVPTALQVRLAESLSSFPASGVTIQFSQTSGPALIFTQGNTAITDANGIATLAGLLTNGEAGLITLEAFVSGLAPAAFTLTNQALPIPATPILSINQALPILPSNPSNSIAPVAPVPMNSTPAGQHFTSEISTILFGQEQEELPLEKTLCQLLEERDETVLEIDGVPVESALAAECR